MKRPKKITFGGLREMSVRGVVVYCQDYKCSHSQTLSADRWPDDRRLSDIELQFVCKACGKRGGERSKRGALIIEQLDWSAGQRLRSWV